MLGPVTKISLANGDLEQWPETTSGTNVIKISTAPNPVLPKVAGDFKGEGRNRQWQNVDMRSVGEFSVFHEGCFWTPVTGYARPAVAGGEQTAGWLPFAKALQKKPRCTLDHTEKLLIYIEGDDTRRDPATLQKRWEKAVANQAWSWGWRHPY